MSARSPMAVVGMAGRFPGAIDLDQFWKNILGDVCSIGPLPTERLHPRYYDPEIGAYGKSYSRIGGLVDPLVGDPSRGRLSAELLAGADVAHLLALEVARQAVEDAGYDPFGLGGKNIGVIVGHARGSMLLANQAFTTAVEAMLASIRDLPRLKALGAAGLAKLEAEVIKSVRDRYAYAKPGDAYSGASASALSSLISRCFGLTGRQLVVDAACASSFAALEIACEALAQGKLDAAIVGGASYSQELSVIMFAQSRALSPDGSFPFDKRANGFISSDGFGLLVLRRLEDAIRDGNKIRAVIRGLGGSCDGKGKALWAPRREGQVVAIKRAYEQSGVDPKTIGLLEGHATSTPLGDRTELEALHECFAGPRRGAPLPIGSVKGNIGHAREAAGIAGLIKVIYALEHATLPPTGGFRDPSPEIPWHELAVEVITGPRPFPADGVRRAAVDAFGIGGLNYHVVVEEPPPEKRVFAVAPRLEKNASQVAGPRDVAIVGLGLRVPGATTPEAFWSALIKSEDVTIEAPPERWPKALYYQAGASKAHRTYGARGAFVTGFTADWRRYQVPPKLIERNDPLQFLLLESALDAMEDAGLDPAKVDRTRIATLVGSVFGSDYALELALAIRAEELAELIGESLKSSDPALKIELLEGIRKNFPTINEDSSGSFSSSTLASRTSKQLDLMGPTYSIDASCASSMASLEAASELLRGKSVDWVVWGGGDRSMRAQRFEYLSANGTLSKGGQPHPYDEGADGLVPGEGAGVCVLRRLEDALADGDRIYAVIRGIGSASDAEVKGEHGLKVAIDRARNEAGAGTVGYVEGYGAAIPRIDAAEVAAVRKGYDDAPMILGTLTGTFGHTQGAAGVLAMEKTAMSLSRGQVPPTKGHHQPNGLALGHIRISNQLESLDEPRAGVSALGGNGASYHAILEKAGGLPDHVYRIAGDDPDAVARQLAATSAEALFKERLQGAGPAVLSFTAVDLAELERAIQTTTKTGLGAATADLREKQGVWWIPAKPAGKERIAFLMSGQGSQYAGMMKGLAESEPAARALLEQADRWHEGRGLPAISKVMTSGAPIPAELYWVQASVLIADLMAGAALKAHGVVPTAITGHSFGDYAALVATGAWTLETALEATRRRAAAIGASTVKGGMIAVSAGRAQVEAALGKAPGLEVEIANDNAEDQVVLAGPIAGLDAVEAHLGKEGLEARRLEVPGPFHSSWMGEAKADLAKSLVDLPISSPQLPYLSSVTGRYETDPEVIRAALIAQLVEPVRWVRQIEQLLADGTDVFIECGPKAVLTGLTRRAIKGTGAVVVPVDDAQRPGRWALARVSSLLDARRASRMAKVVVAAASTTQLPLLVGDAADRLSLEPGFAEFWARTQPTIAAMVEGLWASERARTIPPAPVVAVTVMPAPIEVAESAADGPSRAEIEAFLLDAICKESGYPPDIVGIDADLEADLGIDTVKQAQVLGRVRDKFNLRTEQKLSLRDFPTLRHILDYVDKSLKTKAAEPKKDRPKVPVLDLTARRSQKPVALPVPAAVTVKPAPPPEPPAAPKATGSIFTLPTPSKRPAGAVEPVTVLHLKGTARAIGRQHGEHLRESILEVLDRYQRFLGERGDVLLALPGATDRLRASFDAASLEELGGIAEGVGVPLDYLLAYNLDAALFPALTPGCTQAVRLAKNNGGRMIHLVNEDSPLLLHLGGVLPRVVQIRSRTDGPLPSRQTVFFSLAGQLAGPNGVTSDGLTITSTTLLDAPEPKVLPDGMPHPQLVKQLLEEARDLEDVRRIVHQARRAGRWSLLVSEAEADRAQYLEYDGKTILRDEAISGGCTTANHALAGPAVGATAPEHSCLRAQRLETLLSEKTPLDAPTAQAALRDRFDLGRKRAVTHATMNTVRRVDNVMSLVVEPNLRRLSVSDRVVAPGAAETEEVGFLSLSYGGDEAEPIQVEAIDAYSADGAGIARVPEVMSRWIVRTVELELPQKSPSFSGGTALLVGKSALAEALAQELGRRQIEVTRAKDATAALELLAKGATPGVLALVAASEPVPAYEQDAAAWSTRRAEALKGTFAVVRAFAGARNNGVILGVSVQGGLFGFDNGKEASGETGGLVGLLKAIRHERPEIAIRAVDTSPTDAPATLALAIGRCLDHFDRPELPLEIGLLRGKIYGLKVLPSPAAAPRSKALPKSWILTGGARGITAKMALRLAELYRPTLHLIGRQALPDAATIARWRGLSGPALEEEKRALAGPGATPLAWRQKSELVDKVKEIDANLEALRATGAQVHYWAVDVVDRAALERALLTIRGLGPIEGLIHGAGSEQAKSLDKKSDEIFEATVGPKVDGLVHLLALTQGDPISHLIGFSSVSGRFGGHGQSDYAMANEALVGLVSSWRATHPDRKATVIAWPAFDEVGMAARSSSRIFLERAGQAFMSPAEGANHLVRELWAGLPEPEVIIAEKMEALDKDRTMVGSGERRNFRRLVDGASDKAILGRPVLISEERRIFEPVYETSAPYLDQHRIGTTPILPAVIVAETLLELAEERAALEGFVIKQPLKLAEGSSVIAKAERRGDLLRLTVTARRLDGVVLEPDRIYAEAYRATQLAPRPFVVSATGGLVPYPYPNAADPTPGSRIVFHGPAFRTLLGVRPGVDCGSAELIAPDPAELLGGARGKWSLPAAVLDGCLQATGLLGRILYGTFALPAGFERLDVDARALPKSGARLELAIRFRDHDATKLRADLSLVGEKGPILSIIGYEAKGGSA